VRALHRDGFAAITASTRLACAVGFVGAAAAQQLPVVDGVIGNNFGHLPMFVGVDQGFFNKHGVDVRLKVVNTGTDMVNAMQKCRSAR
jgi:ABC-type nitrate/sulfonate/bicarbonate transport system substrate-binding protein